MDELSQIKKLAGVNEYKGPQVWEGSNISITGSEKGRIQRERNIKPGTPDWFKLWFSMPFLTGEKPVDDEEKSKK